MLEPLLAAAALLVCLALLLHMVRPARQRQRIDAALRRAGCAGRQRLRRGRSDQAQRRKAAQAAQAGAQAEAQAAELIRRARRAAQQDGNVIRPDAFKRPRKPH